MTEHQTEAAAWFKILRDRIIAELNAIEAEAGSNARFEIKSWSREEISGQPGGGEIGLLRGGKVFEKAGVNISTVWGEFSEEFRSKIPGTETSGQFWASGISLVIHPLNPFVPPVHMNTRHIVTSKGWFGGGADLNPIYTNDADTAQFHDAFEQCCARHNETYYPRFKQWADEYFWNVHRKEHRGVGGIFYDYLEDENAFEFTQDVGATFLEIYPKIVRAHMHDKYDQTHEEFQLFRRGRYAEFNLLYDRGTTFGLKTGGNPEAILMSLPPRVTW